jgi:hypothetical protein
MARCARIDRFARRASSSSREIETTVVGMSCHDAAIAPGERANLEREPENRHDAYAIRVENGVFDAVGYLFLHHVERCHWSHQTPPCIRLASLTR